jgi:hypothetical protein
MHDAHILTFKAFKRWERHLVVAGGMGWYWLF